MIKYKKCCKSQRGQALPLGIAFLMSAVLFGIVLFNTGQLASEKSRLANTADAAVYSGLIWQARALNFQAYTNRAMVANQVSIGQMVSFASWTKYASILVRNIDYIGNFIWFIKGFTQTAKSIIDQVDNVVVNIVEGVIPVIDSVNGVLSTAQQAVYLSSFAATPEIVKEVVEKNDSRYNVDSAYAVMGLGENAIAWNNFAKRYEDKDSLLRKANIINRSKDEFTNARNINQSDLLPGLPNKLYLIPGLFRVWIKKEGRTNLVIEEGSSNSNDLEWEWKGKDTLSLHIERFKCSWRGCGWKSSEIPMGWGSRYVNGDFECEEDENGNEVCLPYMDENKTAESFADGENEEIDADYEGVRAYYDLKDLSEQNKDPRLVLRVEVQAPGNQVETSTKINGLGSPSSTDALRNGIGTGMFWAGDKMAANSIASMASGEIYFHPPDDYRPDKRQGKVEVGNLFSPYWEVRLTKTPIERRLMAWGLRDSSLLTDGASGVASGTSLFMSQKAEELQQLLRYEQQLQSQLDNTTDPTEQAQLRQQLGDVQSQIQQQQSQNQTYDNQTLAFSGGMEQGLQQGISDASQVQIGQYEQQLETYAQQQGEDYAQEFEDQVVDQITGQLEQALEGAIEDAVDSALSSFGI